MKRIKDDSLKVLVEAMTPSQYRKFKRLYEGRLSSIARNIKNAAKDELRKAEEAENPSYLSNEEVDELTQEFIDKCRGLKNGAIKGLRKGRDIVKKGYRKTRGFLNKEYDTINNAPAWWEEEDDDEELL